MMSTVMYLLSSLITVLALILPVTSSFLPSYDPTTPLILSDLYLTNSSTIAEARRLSLVSSLPSLPTLPFTLHSAFFPISPTCSLYFQLFSLTSFPPSTPLIVFLAGGPGLAGSYWTLYGGVTPLLFNATTPPSLVVTSTSWASAAHLLVIDHPTGVGFSNCSSRAGDVTEAVHQLRVFMEGFYGVWSEYKRVDVYIAGHSYGGRTAPDLAAVMRRDGLPVAGVIVESGLTEAYLSFSETCNAVYQQGMTTPTELDYCTSALQLVRLGMQNRSESSTQRGINGVLSSIRFANNGFAYQDFERDFSFINQATMVGLLTSKDARLALHVGDWPYSPLVSYSFTDHWSGESLTSLDAVLEDGREERVLYFASNKDSLIGSSALRLLNASDYSRRTQWAITRRAEALTEAGKNVTRGFLKRDRRLWFATVFDASHEISIVSPLSQQIVRSFITADRLSEDFSVLEDADPLPSPGENLSRGRERKERKAALPLLSPADLVVSPAVYLTPFLDSANGAQLAQQASAVSLPQQTVLSDNSTFAGYITIDSTYNSNSFFWLLPSLDGNASAPLILHLSGGPGISSMAMGFLYQHGPFEVVQDSQDPLATRPRRDSYNEHNHMLYVDNPIGTGFSFTMDSRGLRSDSRQIAGDLYEFLRQFYLLFPSYRTSSRLYIHGVSYAGHFLPTLGARIHMENQRRSSAEYMPFEGLFIASGWMDAPSQRSQQSDFYVSIGRMDPFDRARLIGCNNKYCDLDYYNYVWGDVWEDQEDRIMRYLTHPTVVSALHAGPRGLNITSFNDAVNEALSNDPSVKPEVEVLLASGNYRVVMYTAEYDVVCAASGVVNLIKGLNYTFATGWESFVIKRWWQQPTRPESQSRQPPYTAESQPFPVQRQAILWRYSADFTLTYAMIRFAGHLIEQTHLYQAGQILSLIQTLPTLPKPSSAQLPSSSAVPASSTSPLPPTSVLPTAGPTPSDSSSGSPTTAPTPSESSSGSSSPVEPSDSSSTGDAPEQEEEEGFFHTGVGLSLILLLIFCVIIGSGAFLQLRKERKAKEARWESGGGPVGRETMRTSLLGDEEKHYGNSTL